MKYYLDFLRRRNETQDGSDEGSGPDTTDTEISDNSDIEVDDDEDDNAGDDESNQPEPSAEPKVPESNKPDKLSELIDLLKQQAVSKETKKEEPKTLSEEELEASFGKLKLTKEDLASMGFFEADDKQIAAFQKVFDQLSTYAIKKAEHLANKRLSEASSEYEPIRQEYHTRKQEAFRNDFYTKNPQFKGKEELVAIVAKSLSSDPQVVNLPPDKLQNLLATTVNQLLTKAGVANPNPAKPAPQNKVPKPNNLSTAGGSSERKGAPGTKLDDQASRARSILG